MAKMFRHKMIYFMIVSMRIICSLTLICFILEPDRILGQSSQDNKNGNFLLTGKIIGRDTGSVIVWHDDKNNNFSVDTVRLIDGKFRFSGTINRACEAFLFTDLTKNDRDDSSVIRFLAEPGHVFISHRQNELKQTIISGSKAEIEKEQWDQENKDLLNSKNVWYEKIKTLARRARTDSTAELQGQLNHVQLIRDSINKVLRLLDLKYIKKHPASFLSCYLLWKHSKNISVDSVTALYNAMTVDVKKSSIGIEIMDDLYTLTDDTNFRRTNLALGRKFDEKLRKIRSVYDLSEKDSLGNVVPLNNYKGKYLVIDFWASWCKPCLENIGFLNKLAEDYSHDSVLFISISVDENAMNWKRSLRENNFGGVQLLDNNGFEGLAAVYCKILFVPGCVIANPKGRIIRYLAPQASDPALKAFLDSVLKR